MAILNNQRVDLNTSPCLQVTLQRPFRSVLGYHLVVLLLGGLRMYDSNLDPPFFPGNCSCFPNVPLEDMKDKCDDHTSGTAVQLCPDEPAVIAVFMGISWVSMTGLSGFNGDFMGSTHVLMGMMDDQLLINQQTRVFPKIFGQTHVFLFGVQ